MSRAAWYYALDGAVEFEVVFAHLDGFARVKLRGDLDHQATTEYAEALREVIDLRERVVLDLSELHFIDSSGLALLVKVSRGRRGSITGQ